MNYPGILVWLNTTGPGTIVLTATATVSVSKVSLMAGTPNLAVFIGDSWYDCRQDPYFATVSMLGDTAGSDEVSVALQEVLAISSAGTHPFYINAELLTSGGNPATILRASLLGIFYPPERSLYRRGCPCGRPSPRRSELVPGARNSTFGYLQPQMINIDGVPWKRAHGNHHEPPAAVPLADAER